MVNRSHIKSLTKRMRMPIRIRSQNLESEINSSHKALYELDALFEQWLMEQEQTFIDFDAAWLAFSGEQWPH